MKKTILILNQKKYDFTDDKGNHIVGQKACYINNDRLEFPSLVGVTPFTVNLENLINSTQIPGLFEVEIFNIPSPKGQSIEVLKNFKHIRNVDISKIFG